jgi:hypothetical protein
MGQRGWGSIPSRARHRYRVASEARRGLVATRLNGRAGCTLVGGFLDEHQEGLQSVGECLLARVKGIGIFRRE